MNRKDRQGGPKDELELERSYNPTGEEVEDPEERSDVGSMSHASLKADPYGEGVAGIPPLEEEADPQDILPDHIEGGEELEEERELTARPHHAAHPILPDELPEG